MKIWKILMILTALLLCTSACNARQEETPEPEATAPAEVEIVVLVAETPKPTPEPTPELPAEPETDWSAEAEYLAKTVYGEAGNCSTTEQAAVMWCVLNRVDSARFPDDIASVVTQYKQFHGYSEDHPVIPEVYELALDVIDRWQREKNGETDVGRVLPAEWLFFYGDLVKHNYFQKEYKGKELWDWSLPSPYEA